MKKNFSPKIWGPFGWYFFHIISFTYSIDDIIDNKENIENIDNKENIKTNKKYYVDFFKVISNLLPCMTCQFHYKKILNFNPISEDKIQDREDLIKWVLKTHNFVNIIIGRKKYTLTRLKELYITNNQLNVNHKLLYKFLYYIIHSPINKNKNGRRNIGKLFNILIEIFPCFACRDNIKILLPFYSQKNNYNGLLVKLLKGNH